MRPGRTNETLVIEPREVSVLIDGMAQGVAYRTVARREITRISYDLGLEEYQSFNGTPDIIDFDHLGIEPEITQTEETIAVIALATQYQAKDATKALAQEIVVPGTRRHAHFTTQLEIATVALANLAEIVGGEEVIQTHIDSIEARYNTVRA